MVRNVACLVSLALVASTASANDIFRTGGDLGGSIQWSIAATPVTGYALLPSLTEGPTPLSLFDPDDPRSMDVGLDLLKLLKLGVTDAAGNATTGYVLPGDPSLAGIALNAQCVEIVVGPGTAGFGAISNATSTTLGVPGTSVFNSHEAYAPIFGQTSTLLGDGRVLLVGGYDDTTVAGVVKTMAVYDPQTEEMTVVPGEMVYGHVLHTATVLADGRVLVVGGADETATPRKESYVFDPATDTFAPIADLLEERAGHTATLMPDGRVWVAGGIDKIDAVNVLDNVNNVLASTEIYDPVADTWTKTADLPTPLLGHRASLMPLFNFVLITGGLEIVDLFGTLVPNISKKVRRFNGFSVETMTDMHVARTMHGQIVLPDNNILVVAGSDIDTNTLQVIPKADVEVYDILTDTWTVLPSLNHPRVFLDLLCAEQNELIAIGGYAQGDLVDLILGYVVGLRQIETSPIGAVSWTHVADMLLARKTGGGSLLIDGDQRILTVGEGDNGNPGVFDASVELFVR